ncbi:MAG: S8 family serine peptidase [Piscinibacter sp.]|uniref:S8 family serine peptidase n=1 Tax=Piscinibacter sp. TaxID=1903157 RepID=UPI00258FE5C5|nr:S8 family serine peptidase [Piscinibacter sp.]MCW5664743.1 S8 family serine peptidase [Piscinibacter sp.]
MAKRRKDEDKSAAIGVMTGAKDRPRYDKGDVSIEVTLQPEGGKRSAFTGGVLPSVANLEAYRAPMDKMVEAARLLQQHGVLVHNVSDLSISASCGKRKFETLFGSRLVEKKMPDVKLGIAEAATYLAPDAHVAPPAVEGLRDLIERVYVQVPPIFFAGERTLPPFWNDKFRLRVPVDVADLMRASAVHRRGFTGRGVRVAMADTGFYRHPFFVEQGYNFLAVTAPDATDHTTDGNGHGTGECANLYATAPGINFVGVKMGPSTTLAIKTAADLRPQVMTNSWGYSLDVPGSTMPNFLVPLYLAVLDAVSKGITVCFSAGNGHFAFPGSMPEVISVGGVVVDANLAYSATPYTSGFDSTWFPGRRTPDVSGLCGVPPTADYIVLPVQAGASLERQGGWGAFSGTSAASPMVAGVCALLKEIDPGLTPEQIRNILKHTARDIVVGVNAHGRAAAPGPDGATGFGLVDAARAAEVLL